MGRAIAGGGTFRPRFSSEPFMTTSLCAWPPDFRKAFFLCLSLAVFAFAQGGITIFGRVVLPDGNPAVRVLVRVEMANGLKREVRTDDDGRYEFRGISAGRYHLSAVNPDAPEQFTEPAESDSTRSYANRLQMDLYFRLPLHGDKREAKPGTINAAQITQEIPKEARKAYEQGLKLQKENRAQPAIEQFTKAIDLYPGYFQALTERGNLWMAENKLAQAETDFEQALKLNSKYPPALRGLGYCQIQQKNFSEAVGNLERSYALEPDVPLTLLLLGYANLSLNRIEPARQCLHQALKLGPDAAARAHVYLAEIYSQEQNFQAAADEIRKYLSAKPQAPDAAQLKDLESQWRTRAKEKR